jgi:ribosomal protein S12 methylthiotransferase accessory factor
VPLTSFGEFERNCRPEHAIQQAIRLSNELGLILELTIAGDALQTSNCRVIAPNGASNSGRGKGIGAQSLASAIFEAIEHHYYSTEDVELLPIIPLDLHGRDNALVGCSPNFESLAESGEVPLSRLSFKPIGQQIGDLQFPAFLMDPFFEPKNSTEKKVLQDFKLLRYSTNSGTASGSTETEALLHGLLETIERDAIGVELLKVIFRQDPHPVRHLSLESLPAGLQDLTRLACSEATATIDLWDITTDLGIPAVLAALSPNGSRSAKCFGSGASLSASYAIERAVLEALQCFHTYTVFNSMRPLFGILDYEANTFYQRCYLEAGHFDYRGGSTEIEFNKMSQPHAFDRTVSPPEQMTYLVDLLFRHGMGVYGRSIFADQIHVTQVVVPKLERFHLVSQGIPVVPNARGRAVLANS